VKASGVPLCVAIYFILFVLVICDHLFVIVRLVVSLVHFLPCLLYCDMYEKEIVC
jgi:uncharacterized membrane protein